MRKTTIKFLLCTMLLTMIGNQTFACVIGAIQTKGAVAYNLKEQYIVELEKGTPVKIIDLQEALDTYLIEVDEQTVELDKDTVSIRKVIMKTTIENVKVRTAPDPDAELIRTLNVGELVSVLFRSGNWYNVVLDDGTEGFIYKEQLKKEELALLPEKEFKTTKVELIHWDEAKQIIPRGAVVTIEDVYTGKTFKVKRTFGTNHADVEALTTSDTQMIKNIWGGFSWERRPVIVHTNGRMLAASLAGMPHAGDSLDAVAGNGMSGVIDLHFLGSRRHKEGNIQAVVDPQHQAAIKIAANYKK